MVKKINKEIFRINDKVQIINPEIFVRCGYPLAKEDIKNKEITAEERQKIANLLGCAFVEDIDYFSIYEKMLDNLAYYKLKKKRFGGKERRIHTENKPEYKDNFGTIISKKIVKSGDYNYGREDCEGDYYSPPYLTNEKSHVILYIRTEPIKNDIFGDYIEIESINVKKIRAGN